MCTLGKLGSCLPLLLLLAGCSSSGSSTLSLFPQGHLLIPEARALKSSYPDPLPLPRELDKRVSAAYVVEPGDVLLVQPVNLESPVRLPGDQPVLPDGTVNLGRYGRMPVAGKTVDQIETEVRALIEPQTKDAGPITVRLVTRQSKVYYVLGEVNSPGAFPLSGRETVLDAIMTAGGLNSRSSRHDIVLSRPTKPDGCRTVFPICYNEIVQLGDTSTNYQIAAGDRIYVPTKCLFEDMLGNSTKKVCLPCGRPQSPCPFPADGQAPCGPSLLPAEVSPAFPPPGNAVPVARPYPVTPGQ
jgi:protein involved in polysaccharide export with SLBB domain